MVHTCILQSRQVVLSQILAIWFSVNGVHFLNLLSHQEVYAGRGLIGFIPVTVYRISFLPEWLCSHRLAKCKQSCIPYRHEKASRFREASTFDGASDRARTGDPRFTRAVLYQLSYAGWLSRYEYRQLLMVRANKSKRKGFYPVQKNARTQGGEARREERPWSPLQPKRRRPASPHGCYPHDPRGW